VKVCWNGYFALNKGQSKNWRWPRLNKEGNLKYLKYFGCNKIGKRGDQQIGDGDG
jgi:hypothetical protein